MAVWLGGAVGLGLMLVAQAASAEAVTVRREALPELKDVLATVESLKSPPARVRTGGTLTDVVVREGDAVKAGDLLARVRDPKLELQINAVEARIAALAAKRQLVQTELERARALKATGATSQARVDDSETQAVMIEGDLASARAERAVILEQQREGDILAPVSGRVLTVPAVAGQVVLPGEVVATLATSGYVLKLRLPERHARFLKSGDTVMVGARGLDLAGAALTPGKIVKVYPELERGQVVADAEAAGVGDFFVGERVRVMVSTGERPAILVPEAALIVRSGAWSVKLADGREVPVQPGERLPGMNSGPPRVEILTGLRDGDQVSVP